MWRELPVRGDNIAEYQLQNDKYLPKTTYFIYSTDVFYTQSTTANWKFAPQ